MPWNGKGVQPGDKVIQGWKDDSKVILQAFAHEWVSIESKGKRGEEVLVFAVRVIRLERRVDSILVTIG